MKDMLILGKTPEGRDVYAGVFYLHDTLGLPAGMTAMILWDDFNGVVAWEQFARDAFRAGWKEKKIISVIKEALIDFHPQSAKMIKPLVARVEGQEKRRRFFDKL